MGSEEKKLNETFKREFVLICGENWWWVVFRKTLKSLGLNKIDTHMDDELRKKSLATAAIGVVDVDRG